MLYATLDGRVRCAVCGRFARLDMLSRWMISLVLAVLLPAILLYGGFFYSGHLFIVSMLVILGAWRFLSWIGLPFLTLEPATRVTSLPRRGDALILGVLVVVALLLDAHMSSRFEPEESAGNRTEVAPALQRNAQ